MNPSKGDKAFYDRKMMFVSKPASSMTSVPNPATVGAAYLMICGTYCRGDMDFHENKMYTPFKHEMFYK